jgi:hypothetical protein
MAYASNPFLEKRSDRTTSDQEFVRLFSPKILDRLPDKVFDMCFIAHPAAARQPFCGR